MSFKETPATPTEIVGSGVTSIVWGLRVEPSTESAISKWVALVCQEIRFFLHWYYIQQQDQTKGWCWWCHADDYRRWDAASRSSFVVRSNELNELQLASTLIRMQALSGFRRRPSLLDIIKECVLSLVDWEMVWPTTYCIRRESKKIIYT